MMPSAHEVGCESFIKAWQSSYTAVCQEVETSGIKDIKEPPNTLALAINLQPLHLKEASTWVQTATEDEIKDHKGLRTAFVIVEMLHAGFTYVSTSDDSFKPKKDSKVRTVVEQKDRLAIFDSPDAPQASGDSAGEDGQRNKKSVLLYTYKGESKIQKGQGDQKKPSYLKTKRFEDYTSVSPGENSVHWFCFYNI